TPAGQTGVRPCGSRPTARGLAAGTRRATDELARATDRPRGSRAARAFSAVGDPAAQSARARDLGVLVRVVALAAAVILGTALLPGCGTPEAAPHRACSLSDLLVPRCGVL